MPPLWFSYGFRCQHVSPVDTSTTSGSTSAPHLDDRMSPLPRAHVVEGVEEPALLVVRRERDRQEPASPIAVHLAAQSRNGRGRSSRLAPPGWCRPARRRIRAACRRAVRSRAPAARMSRSGSSEERDPTCDRRRRWLRGGGGWLADPEAPFIPRLAWPATEQRKPIRPLPGELDRDRLALPRTQESAFVVSR